MRDKLLNQKAIEFVLRPIKLKYSLGNSFSSDPNDLEISLSDILKFSDLNYVLSFYMDWIANKKIKLKDLKIKYIKEMIKFTKGNNLRSNAAILIYQLIKDNLDAANIKTGAIFFNDYRKFDNLDKCDGRSFLVYFFGFDNEKEKQNVSFEFSLCRQCYVVQRSKSFFNRIRCRYYFQL